MINQASRKKNQVISLRNEQVIPSLVQEYESVRKCRFLLEFESVLERFESDESVQVLGGPWVLIGE
ncbi:hypothetical protein HanXRQr2_Chr10g0448201 [Helianthus annuus]|uniref:Uncharacterized protein n=1 Tax=Helianthus annuus TaxID=4232 RepID=A0A9K3N505_HELAN|nr:hypothetical protein HanXRQr2_Chr10g0448201 [Helianthus annuus]KAJ0921762.1 hypothetical protein HanPSC8_Chr05g0195471 [Helianthus annuus]